MIMQCVVPEKIHAHPKEGLRKFQGGGGFKKPYFLKESMTLKWNFRRGGGGGVQTKKPSVRGAWIFSGTTQGLSQMMQL